uniref:Uncharacterized protein n=1 Tax=Timema bartmani TaxID=61472 RepID=A0A7R9F374_9NEOP|nr:unnamed protein product [Timema bartmani]
MSSAGGATLLTVMVVALCASVHALSFGTPPPLLLHRLTAGPLEPGEEAPTPAPTTQVYRYTRLPILSGVRTARSTADDSSLRLSKPLSPCSISVRLVQAREAGTERSSHGLEVKEHSLTYTYTCRGFESWKAGGGKRGHHPLVPSPAFLGIRGASREGVRHGVKIQSCLHRTCSSTTTTLIDVSTFSNIFTRPDLLESTPLRHKRDITSARVSYPAGGRSPP